MKIKGAIFDMDGTLLDSMGAWHTLSSRFVRSLGYEIEEGFEQKMQSLGYPKNREYLQTHYAPQMTLEQINDAMLQCMTDYYRKEVQLLPHVSDLLEELKRRGVKMCIASATHKEMCEVALKTAGIDHYFSEIFDVSGTGKNKNYPDIFENALKHLGTPKEETPVFEDAYYSIKTCKAAGFPVVAIRDAWEPLQDEVKALADVYVLSYGEMDKIITE